MGPKVKLGEGSGVQDGRLSVEPKRSEEEGENEDEEEQNDSDANSGVFMSLSGQLTVAWTNFWTDFSYFRNAWSQLTSLYLVRIGRL